MGCNQRVGLLVLGYLKLILIDLLGLGLNVHGLVVYRHMLLMPLIIFVVTTVLLLSDTVFSIILLYGSHKRNRTLLRVYFWYSIVGFILSVLQTGYTVYSYYMAFTFFHDSWRMVVYSYEFYLGIFLFGLFNLVIQLCIMVLVKRDIRDLGTKKTSDDAELHHV